MDKKTKYRTYCSAPQCNSMAGNDRSLSFHRFPKKRFLRLQWILALKIGKEVSNYMSVCSLHFDNSCFFKKEGPTLKKNLKKNSVPTLCLPIAPYAYQGKYQQKMIKAMEKNSRHEASVDADRTGSSGPIVRDELLKVKKLEAPKKKKLSTATSQLSGSSTVTDFTLKAGGKSFPVHRNILSARSSFFKAYFSNDMKEKRPNTLIVTDIDEETMDAFLKFVYYENVKVPDFEFCVKMYIVASKYQVSDLRGNCINYMKLHFSVDNVCNALRLAHACNDKQLYHIAVTYVYENWKSIAPSAQFKQLMEDNEELAAKLDAYCMNWQA